MQIRKVAGKRYWEPTHLKDVPFGRLVKYFEVEPEFLASHQAAQKGGRWEKLKFVRQAIQAISIVSGIPEDAIGNIRNPMDKDFNLYGEFASLFQHYFQFFRRLEYRQDFKAAKNLRKISFKANGKRHTFFLFRMEQITTKQYLFFSEYMARFMDQTVEEIKADFSHLPALISCLAWKRKELGFSKIGEPEQLKDKTYRDFVKVMESRQSLFLDMPSSLAYRCLDYFFLNSKDWPLQTRGSSPKVEDPQARPKSSISQTTVSRVPSTR